MLLSTEQKSFNNNDNNNKINNGNDNYKKLLSLNKGKNKIIYVYLLRKSFSDILHHQYY